MDSICEFLDTNLCIPKSRFVEVFKNTIYYILKYKSAFEYQNIISKFCYKLSAKNVRILLTQFRYTFNVKLFVIALKFDNPHRLKSTYQINNKDYVLISRLYRSDVRFQCRVSRICRYIREHEVDVNYVESKLHYMYKDIQAFINYMTYTKLRFIVRANNYDRADLEHDLNVKLVQSYYQLIPTSKSDDYIRNYLRRVVHNHAMNIIHANTSLKGGRTVNVNTKTKPEYRLIVTSENQLSNKDTDVYANISSKDKTSHLELSISIETLLAKYKSKQVRFLKILMGEFDLEFTKFLRARGMCANNEDNTDLILYLTSEETRAVLCEYFEVSDKSMLSFVNEVKKDLGGRDAVHFT